MKKKWKMFVITIMIACLMLPTQPAKAIIWVVVKAAIVKAIKAADLAIQRAQNKVIWLQNAQKTLENTMSKLKLTEISDWTERQRTLYKDYFDELNKVKTIITYYQRIKDITTKQLNLVSEYKRAWSIVKSDKNFTAQEIQYIGSVYQGMLNETMKNVDQLTMVVNSFKTQMSDAKRLEIINQTADDVDMNYADLKRFNGENAMLSLKRSKSQEEIDLVKAMYGLKD